jgi:hypothetical protein
MARFLFVYRNCTDAHGTMTPEQMQLQMQKWHAWINEGFEKGWMVNAGDGLKKEGRIVGRQRVVTDGPFVESKEVVGGFSIVEADSLDDAAALAQGCPALLADGTVEVRPLAGFTAKAEAATEAEAEAATLLAR